ncbi:hypothetical protein B0H17DRAFT_1262230 [Mycena rosella]|uniref:Uncharacterized protein n=1 Tax=Mycena rosella TaxID=1033263 RepID=A0AAD7G5P5_MYCRO|nr:hypothetical protein B0H17DRAFT_1262230 [Mycena rosella]
MPQRETIDSGEELFGDDNRDKEEEFLQPVDINATKDELIKALEHCQLALGRILAENRGLRQSNSELQATSTSKRRRREKGDNQLGYEQHIGPLARRFLFTNETWVRTSDFRKDRPELFSNAEDRFANNNMYSRAVTAALFDSIPEKYHSLLDYTEYRHFAKDFIAELGNARSSMINSVRGVIASILSSAGHSVNNKILGSANADRSKDKVLLGLLRFPEDNKSKLFAPILFPQGKKRLEYIFTSQIVLEIHRVMVHGQSSLGENSKPDPKANGTKYGISEATDHSIALAGTLARFLVSADKLWASKGAITEINWEDNYRTYRKLLTSNPDAPSIKNIFRTFNKHVFAGVPKTAGNTNEVDEDDDVEDEINAAMHRLAFGDFDDDRDESDGNGEVLGDDSNVHIDVPVRDWQPIAGPSHLRQVRFADGPPHIQEYVADQDENSDDERPRRSSRRAGSQANGRGKGPA